MGAERKRPNRRWERRARYRADRARARAYEAGLIQSAARARERAMAKHEVSLTVRDMFKHLGRLLRGHRVTRRERLLGEQPGGVDE